MQRIPSMFCLLPLSVAQGGECSDQAPDPCQSSSQSFSSCPILGIVDVEAQGAREGERQVGDHGHHPHPGGPRDILQFYQV